MPFAKEFIRAMDLPDEGDVIGTFTIESREVGHRGIGGSRYEYPVRYIVSGTGGVQGVRRAFRAVAGCKRTTFSGFGTPYQLRFNGVDVESLGAGRYEVRLSGIGVGFDLLRELEQFSRFVADRGSKISSPEERSQTIETYIAEYKLDVKRKHRRL